MSIEKTLPSPVMRHRLNHIKELDLGTLSIHGSTGDPVIALPLDYFGSQNQLFIFPAATLQGLAIERWFIEPSNKSCHSCNVEGDTLTKIDLGESVYQLFLCIECLERLLKDINRVEDEDMVSAII